MRRRALLVGVLAVAASAAVTVRAFFASDGTAATARTGAAASPARADPRPLESAAVPSGSDALAAVRTSDASSAPPRDGSGTWAEGVITLREQSGQPPTPRDVDAARLHGSFVPDWIDGPDEDADVDFERVPEDDPRRVRVVDGRFRVDTRGATVMLVRALVLDDRAAAVDGGVELSSDAPAQVSAHWSLSCLLHVVDATTHAELRDVTVVARPDSHAALPGVVRRAEIAAERRVSPFHLTIGERPKDALLTVTPWIGAPGHAWRKVELDFTPGAQQTVELEPGARLVVTVQGLEERSSPGSLDRAPRLTLRAPSGGAALVDALAQDDPMDLDGLPTGTFAASLEIGDDSAPRRVLCSTDVELAAGASERVTLAIPPGALVDAVRVAGTLFAPPSWSGPCGFEIRLRPDGIAGATRDDWCVVAPNQLEPVAGEDGWFRWRTGPVQPGAYFVDVDRAEFHERIEVGPSGRDDVALLLPDATRLVVRVVDEETRQPVRLDRITWHPIAGEQERATERGRPGLDGIEPSTRVEFLRFDDSTGACVGVAAAGSGRFEGEATRHRLSVATAARTYAARPGTNEFVLEAQRNCGVELSFDDAAARSFGDGPISVEWKLVSSDHADTRSEQLRHARHALVRTGDAKDDLAIQFPEPGRYRISFPTCASLASFEVDVPEGEFVKCEVRR